MSAWIDGWECTADPRSKMHMLLTQMWLLRRLCILHHCLPSSISSSKILIKKEKKETQKKRWELKSHVIFLLGHIVSLSPMSLFQSTKNFFIFLNWDTIGITYHKLKVCNLMIEYMSILQRDSLVTQLVKNLPAMQETPVQFLGWEVSLEKG